MTRRNPVKPMSETREFTYYAYSSMKEIVDDLQKNNVDLSKTSLEFSHDYNSFGEIESTQLVVVDGKIHFEACY